MQIAKENDAINTMSTRKPEALHALVFPGTVVKF
jgi:hypothetical protein